MAGNNPQKLNTIQPTGAKALEDYWNSELVVAMVVAVAVAVAAVMLRTLLKMFSIS